jgi:hypothetical protein
LSKKQVLPREKKKKKGFDKRQRSKHDNINIFPRGRGLAIKYKSFA